jgi:D-alanine-D-alanine ligase-like ATP-grasp enzyme
MRLTKALAVLVAVSALAGCDKDKTTDADALEYAQGKILELIKKQAPNNQEACETGRGLIANVKKLAQDTNVFEWSTANCRERIDPIAGITLSDVAVFRNKDGSIKSICSNVTGNNYDKSNVTVPSIVNEGGAFIQFEDSYLKESNPEKYKSLQEAFSVISKTSCK